MFVPKPRFLNVKHMGNRVEVVVSIPLMCSRVHSSRLDYSRSLLAWEVFALRFDLMESKTDLNRAFKSHTMAREHD